MTAKVLQLHRWSGFTRVRNKLKTSLKAGRGRQELHPCTASKGELTPKGRSLIQLHRRIQNTSGSVLIMFNQVSVFGDRLKQKRDELKKNKLPYS